LSSVEFTERGKKNETYFIRMNRIDAFMYACASGRRVQDRVKYFDEVLRLR
jgi:hypothetical protein